VGVKVVLVRAGRVLVDLSGVAEIAGVLGLLLERTRRMAGWGLIALYVAVLPANAYRAIERVTFEEGGEISRAALWLRLPFQLVFIVWAYWVSRPRRK
jgi:uncharacterized membrane protein